MSFGLAICSNCLVKIDEADYKFVPKTPLPPTDKSNTAYGSAKEDMRVNNRWPSDWALGFAPYCDPKDTNKFLICKLCYELYMKDGIVYY
jgi:hypothetical protein